MPKQQLQLGTYRVVTPKVKVVQSVFSGEVGEETNALTLKLTLQNDVLEYSSSELLPLARKVLERQLPPDYMLRNEAPQILSLPSLLASTSAQVTLDTNLSAMAEPIIQLPQFAPTLTGKHLEEAEKHVLAHPGVAGVQISFSPH